MVIALFIYRLYRLA